MPARTADKKKKPRDLVRETVKKRLTAKSLNEQLRSRLEFQRGASERFADLMTRRFGSVGFLMVNMAVFVAWILANTGVFGIEPFDPYPFGMLTMVVSLEAIVLSIVVLISQNRQGHIADVRQQLDFEIDMRAEEEITRILILLEKMHDKLGLRHEHDAELEEMKKVPDIEKIKAEIEKTEE